MCKSCGKVSGDGSAESARCLPRQSTELATITTAQSLVETGPDDEDIILLDIPDTWTFGTGYVLSAASPTAGILVGTQPGLDEEEVMLLDLPDVWVLRRDYISTATTLRWVPTSGWDKRQDSLSHHPLSFGAGQELSLSTFDDRAITELGPEMCAAVPSTSNLNTRTPEPTTHHQPATSEQEVRSPNEDDWDVPMALFLNTDEFLLARPTAWSRGSISYQSLAEEKQHNAQISDHWTPQLLTSTFCGSGYVVVEPSENVISTLTFAKKIANRRVEASGADFPGLRPRTSSLWGSVKTSQLWICRGKLLVFKS